MNALILAAGLGTRLGDITSKIPKPMIEVNGKSVLEEIILKLLNAGIEKIIINTHYQHNVIEKFISNSNFRNVVKISHEIKILGTAQSVVNNIAELGSEDFMVLHGDNYFSDDLLGLVEMHKSCIQSILLTTGTFEIQLPENFGTFELDSNMVITNFYEKDKDSPFRIANSGIYIMKPKVIETLMQLSETEVDISRDLLPRLIGRMQAYPLKGYFIDIGTPGELERARKINSKQ